MKWLVACLLSVGLVASESRVMGVGYSAIDLLIQVEDEFLDQWAELRKNGSQLGTFERIDELLETSQATPTIVPGGSAANTIRALAKLGQPCAFLADRGLDSWGRLFEQNLCDLNVDFRGKEGPFTARVLCLISSDGQRTFLACDPLEIECLPEPKDFEGIDWVHLEARKMMTGSFFSKTVELAQERAIPMSLDLSCFGTVLRFKDELAHLIANHVDVLFCNQDEVKALTGLDLEEGCLALQKMCSVAVVTLGDKGCLIGANDKLIAVPAESADVIDTTGAGDYFAAGFIYGYLRKQPLEQCARMGHLLASAVVEVIGTQLADAAWQEIHAALQDLSN